MTTRRDEVAPGLTTGIGAFHNGQEVFAEKSIDRQATHANVTVTETTTFKLHHAPVGSGVP